MRILGLGLFLLGVWDAAAATIESITYQYCQRAAITSPRGREDIFRFVSAVQQKGLLTNLVDFAFFRADQNLAEPANPVSLSNTGHIVGEIQRMRGGVAFPNQTNNYGLFFTNYPPTPNGRTVLVWGAPSFYANVSNNLNDVIFELTGPGDMTRTPNPALSFVYLSPGSPNPFIFNGNEQVIGPRTPGAGNSLLAASIASGPAGVEMSYLTDYPKRNSIYQFTNPVPASPTVLRFAIRQCPSSDKVGWPGLIRGFAYFDTILSNSDVVELDMAVTRVGVVFEGDSKTIGNPWPQFYCQSTNTWGLYSILTNSAVGGTVVASASSPYNSMESRWPANSVFKTNDQFPRVIYHLRGGHNDFVGQDCATPSGISNAFVAITNLWALARSNGCTTVGWTIDRTGSTWYGNNSNFLSLIDGQLRDHRPFCDDLMDAEKWFVDNFGETPFLDPDIYIYDPVNPVHETEYGAMLLGLATADCAAPDLPPPPFQLRLRKDSSQASAEVEVSGAPGGKAVQILSSTNLLDWQSITNLLPEAGWAVVRHEDAGTSFQRYYRAFTVP